MRCGIDQESLQKIAQKADGREIPILALRNAVLFPGTVMPLVVGRKKTMDLLASVGGKDEVIGVMTQKERSIDDPSGEDLLLWDPLHEPLRLFERVPAEPHHCPGPAAIRDH